MGGTAAPPPSVYAMVELMFGGRGCLIWIFIQWSCLVVHLRGYNESTL